MEEVDTMYSKVLEDLKNVKFYDPNVNKLKNKVEGKDEKDEFDEFHEAMINLDYFPPIVTSKQH